MNAPDEYLVRVQRVVRARVVAEWKFYYRHYWQANLRSFFEHHFWGHSCRTYRKNHG